MYCIFSRFNFNKFNQIAHHLWATSSEKPLSEQASIKPKWPKLQQISSDMPCIIIINDKHSSLLSLPAVASFSRTSVLYIIHQFWAMKHKIHIQIPNIKCNEYTILMPKTSSATIKQQAHQRCFDVTHFLSQIHALFGALGIQA